MVVGPPTFPAQPQPVAQQPAPPGLQPAAQPPAPSGMIPQPSLPRSLTFTAPSIPGLTNSVPVNLATGGAVVAGTNTITQGAGGSDITFLAGVITMVVHPLMPTGPDVSKKEKVIANALIILIGFTVGIVVFTVIGHVDLLASIQKGAGIAVQTWGNHLGLKIGGIDSMPSPTIAPTPPAPTVVPGQGL